MQTIKETTVKTSLVFCVLQALKQLQKKMKIRSFMEKAMLNKEKLEEMIHFFKVSIASVIFCVCMVFGQSHAYYQDLILQYHNDASIALESMNIDMINGGGWKPNYHGFVIVDGGVSDFTIYINAELLFYSDINEDMNMQNDQHWAKLEPIEGPYTGTTHSRFDPGEETRSLIRQLLEFNFPNGDMQELNFINQTAEFRMLFSYGKNDWSYHTLQCKKLNKEVVALEKETLMCTVIKPSHPSYTEYWIIERELFS